jgi:hypothetical protein
VPVEVRHQLSLSTRVKVNKPNIRAGSRFAVKQRLQPAAVGRP